jgi:uncharacterized protein (TIGR02246 family)
MTDDERAIHDLFDRWIRATTEGDLELARGCIADDAVFFVPGHGTMDKETFAQGAAGTSPEEAEHVYDLDSRLREVVVSGDRAHMWVESVLCITPKAGGDTTRMAGHSLSVLVRRDGAWLIHRDANTLA